MIAWVSCTMVPGDNQVCLFPQKSLVHNSTRCSYFLRLLGWWSIDEGSREEQARLYFDQESG